MVLRTGRRRTHQLMGALGGKRRPSLQRPPKIRNLSGHPRIQRPLPNRIREPGKRTTRPVVLLMARPDSRNALPVDAGEQHRSRCFATIHRSVHINVIRQRLKRHLQSFFRRAPWRVQRRRLQEPPQRDRPESAHECGKVRPEVLHHVGHHVLG